MNRARIVIADNHANVLDVLAHLLSHLDVDVTCCTSGTEVLETIQGGGVDAVITDVEMPVMGGVALTRALKEEKPELPVIMMSSYAGKDMEEEAVSSGAIGLISKPFRLDAIASLLAGAGVQFTKPNK